SISFDDNGKLWVATTSIEKDKYNREGLWGEEQKHSFISIFRINQENKIDSIVIPKIPKPTWLPAISHFSGLPKLIFTHGVSTSNETKVCYIELGQNSW